MVGDKQQKTTRQDKSVELEATLAPAKAEVGAVAKADQQTMFQASKIFLKLTLRIALVDLKHDSSPVPVW